MRINSPFAPVAGPTGSASNMSWLTPPVRLLMVVAAHHTRGTGAARGIHRGHFGDLTRPTEKGQDVGNGSVCRRSCYLSSPERGL